MSEQDSIAEINKRHWEWSVQKGAGCTVPMLDLDPAVLRQYAAGEMDVVPEPLGRVFPPDVLADVEGKDVLCLASGGGQQSAFFGLLGARVTVLDLAEGQLEGDRTAAAHYGYEVTTIQGDMRDLSCFADESFDLVYQTTTCWIPDVREVYSEVVRVLRSGGLYRVDFANPATEFVEPDSWDGEGYRITVPYAQKERAENPGDGPGNIQFRHYIGEILNGLLQVGLSIQQAQDPPHRRHADAQPGTWRHLGIYLGGGFVVVARKDP